MLKTDAIRLLGGTPSEAAKAIGITYQAFWQWPEDLPRNLEDRVIAALVRKEPRKWASTLRQLSSAGA